MFLLPILLKPKADSTIMRLLIYNEIIIEDPIVNQSEIIKSEQTTINGTDKNWKLEHM